MRQIAAALFKHLTMLIDLLQSTEACSVSFSDAAKYMVAAGAILKSLYRQLFHMTCIEHILLNRAMKIKSHLEGVDHLIVKVK